MVHIAFEIFTIRLLLALLGQRISEIIPQLVRNIRLFVVKNRNLNLFMVMICTTQFIRIEIITEILTRKKLQPLVLLHRAW